MGRMMGWLGNAASADADARHLRDIYGTRAEAWCAGALGALAAGDPRRRSIQRIAKALHGLPTIDASPDLSPVGRPVEPSPHHRG